jgi:microsomal epoxide hydrolase
MSSFPEARTVTIAARTGIHGADIPEISLSVHEAGDGPAIVLCHGFPELAYSWRHQVGALADAGFRVLAPDQRGYGFSDTPEPIESYDLEHLTSDLVGLLDAQGIERAVFAGHDWGGFVAWAMPIAYPDRTAGVIGVNTPYVPFPNTQMLRLAFPDDEKLYILWFQKPGVAEAVLDKNPRAVFEKMMRHGSKPETARLGGATGDANPFRRLDELPLAGETMLSEADLDYYTRGFERAGFRGGINWYRNIDRNQKAFSEIGVRKLDLPSLMITAEWDVALRPEMAAGMPDLCSDLEMHQIEACGHWTQQDKADELSALMVDWMKRRFA